MCHTTTSSASARACEACNVCVCVCAVALWGIYQPTCGTAIMLLVVIKACHCNMIYHETQLPRVVMMFMLFSDGLIGSS